MRDRRLQAVLVVAVLVAIGSGGGAYALLVRAQADTAVPTVAIVVSAADLQEGHLLVKSDVRMSTVPRASAPQAAFTSLDSLMGRVVSVPVSAGEPFVPSRLAPIGAGAGLEVKITRGKRAMNVRIDEAAGLSGLIQPNSRVDVLVTVREDAENAQERAKLFMSNMRVLAVGTQTERGQDGNAQNATTATLEVTPSEAEQLAIATNQGKILLVLRGYGDPDAVETKGASISEMMRKLNMAPLAPLVRAAPALAPPDLTAEQLRRLTLLRRGAKPEEPLKEAAAVPTSDSVMVIVYRGDKLTRQRFEKSDSIRP